MLHAAAGRYQGSQLSHGSCCSHSCRRPAGLGWLRDARLKVALSMTQKRLYANAMVRPEQR